MNGRYTEELEHLACPYFQGITQIRACLQPRSYVFKTSAGIQEVVNSCKAKRIRTRGVGCSSAAPYDGSTVQHLAELRPLFVVMGIHPIIAPCALHVRWSPRSDNQRTPAAHLGRQGERLVGPGRLSLPRPPTRLADRGRDHSRVISEVADPACLPPP